MHLPRNHAHDSRSTSFAAVGPTRAKTNGVKFLNRIAASLLSAALLSTVLLASVATAANTWDGGDLDDNLWSSTDNWDNNLVPVFPAPLTYSGTVRLTSNNDLVGVTVNGLTFNVGGGPFTLGGNAFTLNGPITNSSALAQTINNNLTLAASQTITTTGNFTLGGNINDAGNAFGLTKAGAGTLTLLGANTYTGGTILNAGTVNVGNVGALGTTGAISFTGGTLQYSNANQTDYSARFLTAQTYRVDTNGQNVTWATPLTGTGGAVVKSGAGTLTLSGNNTFTGALTINANAGPVVLSGNNTARAAGANNLTVVDNGANFASTATLQLQANAGNTVSGTSFALSSERPGTTGNPLTVNTGSVLQLRSDSSVTFAGANGMGGLGGAFITIDVNNNGTGNGNAITLAPGGFNVSNTTITVTGGNGYSLVLPAITAVVNNITTLLPTTANLSVGTLSGTVAGSHNFTLGGTTTGNVVTGIISDGTGGGTTGIQKLYAGTWTLPAANTYTGATQVCDGLLSLTGSLASPTLTMGGGFSLLGSTTVGGTFSYDKPGTNTQNFTTTNINSGASKINVSVGTNTLNVGNIVRAGYAPAAFTIWSSVDFGTTGTITTTTTTNANGILAGGGVGGAGGGFATFGGNTWAVAPAVSGGAITGLPTASYVNTSVTSLAAAQSTDNLDIASAGTNVAGSPGVPQTVNSLRFNDAAAPTLVNAANGLVLSSGGILVTSAVGNNAVTIDGGTLQGAPARDLVVIQNASNTTTINSVIADNGGATGMTKAGPGTLILTANNTFTGALSINGGTVVLSGNNAARLANTTGLTTVNRGTILQLQANANNTNGGLSTALSPEQTAGQPLVLNNGAILQLRSNDSVNFAGFNGLGGVGQATFAIDVNNNGSGTGNTLTIAPSGFNVAQTTFNVTGGNGYTLAFGTLTTVNAFDHSLTMNPTTADVSIAGINNGQNGALNFKGTGNSTVTGAITGAGPINKSETGTLTLTGINTFSGPINVTGGSVVVGPGGQLGSGTYAGTITNNATFNFASSSNQTLSGVIAGNGTLIHSGSGILTISGTNTATGPKNVTGGGTLRENGNSPNSPINLTFGTLDGQGLGGNVTVANNASNIITNGSGTTSTLALGNLTFSGQATLNLNKANSVSAPALTVGTLATTPANGPITLNILTAPVWSNGSVYNLVGYNSFSGAVSNFTLGTVTGLGARQSAALGSTGASNGFLTVAISGNTPVWTGAKSSVWTTTPVGTPFNWKLQTGGAATEFLSNDQVLFDDSATGSTAIQINDGTVNPISITFNNSTKNYSVSSAFGSGINTGILTKRGTGTLTLNTTNTYSGGTNLTAGTLNINNSSALGTGTLTITGGALGNSSGAQVTLFSSNAQAWNSDFSFVGPNDLDLGSGAVSLGGSRTITVTGPGTLTESGIISGSSFGLTKSGTGTLILSVANNYDGPTSVTAGKLQLANAAALQNSTYASAITDGLSFAASIGSFNLGGLSGSGNQSLVDLASTPVTLNVGTNGANTTYSGSLSGVGAILTKVGAGTLTLTGNNTYDGGTQINAGLLNVGSAGALGTTGAIRFAGGTLQYSAGTTTDYSARFSTDFAQPYRVDTNGQDVTFATGLSSLGGTLVKLGTGTLTLSGANSFTGALTVSANAGTVVLSGENSSRPNNVSGSTTVNAGAFLQLQANAGNTVDGVSTALSSEQTLNNPLIVNNGSTLQLRSNSSVTFAGANSLGGVGQSAFTIDANNNGSGSGNTLTIAPNGFNVAQTTINFTGGNGYTVGIGGPITVVNFADRSLTLNPTTANATIGGSTSLTSSGGTNAVFNLSGTSLGNKITGSIADFATTPAIVNKIGTSTWSLLGTNAYTGATTITAGTLRGGAANTLSPASPVVLNGGTLSTGGFDQVAGTLRLAANSVLDLGIGGQGAAHFSASSTVNNSIIWTAATTLTIDNWTNGLDHLFIGADTNGLDASQLAQITFTGYGAASLNPLTGELTPSVPGPIFHRGDANFDGSIAVSDLPAFLAALTNLSSYKSLHSFNDDQAFSLLDVNQDGVVTNSDIQAELNLLAGLGFGSLSSVPEPSSYALGVVAALSVGFVFRKQRTRARAC